MFDHHADALPDHTLVHHLAAFDVGQHQVSVHDASVLSDVLTKVAEGLPGRLGHASEGLTQVIHGALDVADQARQAHDWAVDAHHGQWHDPFIVMP